LVSSANPHDASSFHSNIAFALAGPICQDILEGERNLAAFSGGVIGPHRVTDVGQAVQEPTIMRYVTEGRIRTALLQEIGRAEAGDRIDIAVFYLSERSIIEALIDATSRGATLRVVLDPNKDAFGREKGGIPNRPVASSNGRIAVRWYDTHGEQFHTKLAVFTRGDSVTVVGGSANLTRRNVGDYNLEANVRLWTHRQSPLARALAGYFERIWSKNSLRIATMRGSSECSTGSRNSRECAPTESMHPRAERGVERPNVPDGQLQRSLLLPYRPTTTVWGEPPLATLSTSSPRNRVTSSHAHRPARASASRL
jgi:HKD family nuclease